MNQKLSEEDRKLIMGLISERERHVRKARELSNRKIGEKFDVHYSTVYKVSRKERRA